VPVSKVWRLREQRLSRSSKILRKQGLNARERAELTAARYPRFVSCQAAWIDAAVVQRSRLGGRRATTRVAVITPPVGLPRVCCSREDGPSVDVMVTSAKDRTARWHRYWDKKSRSYDREMRFFDRHLFGDSRKWACGQATGEVLEVAVGTGLNLDSYPPDVTFTGIDISDAMLDIARQRASELGRPATLLQGDAHELPFDDASFDTVVCTFGLCAIPDHTKAIREMTRVLRPDGRLILVDHIESTSRPMRAVQRVLEVFTVPIGGEHFLRRPLNHIRAAGLDTEQVQRFKLGLVERLVARKPTTP
jgi:ubiquinone/menaquinone biosynthesis C-methylase UbiE